MTSSEHILDIYYQKANEALQSNDVSQVIEISDKGIQEAKSVNNGGWVERFSSLKNQAHSSESGDSQYVGNISRNYKLSIEELIKVKGIGANLARKLCDGDFWSIEAIVNSTPEYLSEIPGISPSSAKTLISNAKESIKSHGHVKNLSNFSVSNEDLDKDISSELIPSTKALLTEQENIDPEIDYFNKDEVEQGDFYESSGSKSLPSKSNSIIGEEDINTSNDQVDQIDELSIDDDDNKYENVDDELLIESEISENLSNSEYLKIISDSKQIFDRYGYQTIEKLSNYNDNINILSFKVIQMNNDVDLVLFIPVKINDFRGSLKISEKSCDYKFVDQSFKVNESQIRTAINSNLNQLDQWCKDIFSNLSHKSNIFDYFREQVDQNLALKKSLLNRKLFFHSGKIQFKFLIEPILINASRVLFMEKDIPFAYQRHANIHITESSKLAALLIYLERKYSLVENYRETNNLVKEYFSSIRKDAIYIRLTSIPLLLVEVLFTFLYLSNSLLFSKFILWGSCLIGIYLILVLFSSFKGLKKNLELSKNFSVPHYRKLYNLDESSITLIREELDNKSMMQFSYECHGEKLNYQIISQLEIEQANAMLNNEKTEEFIRPESLFEIDVPAERINIDKDLDKEFKAFLEDDP